MSGGDAGSPQSKKKDSSLPDMIELSEYRCDVNGDDGSQESAPDVRLQQSRRHSRSPSFASDSVLIYPPTSISLTAPPLLPLTPSSLAPVSPQRQQSLSTSATTLSTRRCSPGPSSLSLSVLRSSSGSVISSSSLSSVLPLSSSSQTVWQKDDREIGGKKQTRERQEEESPPPTYDEAVATAAAVRKDEENEDMLESSERKEFLPKNGSEAATTLAAADAAIPSTSRQQQVPPNPSSVTKTTTLRVTLAEENSRKTEIVYFFKLACVVIGLSLAIGALVYFVVASRGDNKTTKYPITTAMLQSITVDGAAGTKMRTTVRTETKKVLPSILHKDYEEEDDELPIPHDDTSQLTYTGPNGAEYKMTYKYRGAEYPLTLKVLQEIIAREGFSINGDSRITYNVDGVRYPITKEMLRKMVEEKQQHTTTDSVNNHQKRGTDATIKATADYTLDRAHIERDDRLWHESELDDDSMTGALYVLGGGCVRNYGGLLDYCAVPYNEIGLDLSADVGANVTAILQRRDNCLVAVHLRLVERTYDQSKSVGVATYYYKSNDPLSNVVRMSLRRRGTRASVYILMTNNNRVYMRAVSSDCRHVATSSPHRAFHGVVREHDCVYAETLEHKNVMLVDTDRLPKRNSARCYYDMNAVCVFYDKRPDRPVQRLVVLLRRKINNKQPPRRLTTRIDVVGAIYHPGGKYTGTSQHGERVTLNLVVNDSVETRNDFRLIYEHENRTLRIQARRMSLVYEKRGDLMRLCAPDPTVECDDCPREINDDDNTFPITYEEFMAASSASTTDRPPPMITTVTAATTTTKEDTTADDDSSYEAEYEDTLLKDEERESHHHYNGRVWLRETELCERVQEERGDDRGLWRRIVSSDGSGYATYARTLLRVYRSDVENVTRADLYVRRHSSDRTCVHLRVNVERYNETENRMALVGRTANGETVRVHTWPYRMHVDVTSSEGMRCVAWLARTRDWRSRGLDVTFDCPTTGLRQQVTDMYGSTIAMNRTLTTRVNQYYPPWLRKGRDDPLNVDGVSAADDRHKISDRMTCIDDYAKVCVSHTNAPQKKSFYMHVSRGTHGRMTSTFELTTIDYAHGRFRLVPTVAGVADEFSQHDVYGRTPDGTLFSYVRNANATDTLNVLRNDCTALRLDLGDFETMLPLRGQTKCGRVLNAVCYDGVRRYVNHLVGDSGTEMLCEPRNVIFRNVISRNVISRVTDVCGDHKVAEATANVEVVVTANSSSYAAPVTTTPRPVEYVQAGPLLFPLPPLEPVNVHTLEMKLKPIPPMLRYRRGTRPQMRPEHVYDSGAAPPFSCGDFFTHVCVFIESGSSNNSSRNAEIVVERNLQEWPEHTLVRVKSIRGENHPTLQENVEISAINEMPRRRGESWFLTMNSMVPSGAYNRITFVRAPDRRRVSLWLEKSDYSYTYNMPIFWLRSIAPAGIFCGIVTRQECFEV